jgi:hypothetical protein
VELFGVIPDPGDDRSHRAPGNTHQLSDRALGGLGGQPGDPRVEVMGVADLVTGPGNSRHRDPVGATRYSGASRLLSGPASSRRPGLATAVSPRHRHNEGYVADTRHSGFASNPWVALRPPGPRSRRRSRCPRPRFFRHRAAFAIVLNFARRFPPRVSLLWTARNLDRKRRATILEVQNDDG